MKLTVMTFWFLGLAGSLAGLAIAAPQAEVASTKWQLDLTFEDPQRIILTLPGQETPATFWYVLYTVTNNTGKDIQFFPSFRLVTDTLKVVDGGDEISPSVYESVLERHRAEFPFIAAPSKVTGPLLQGEENSRTSVAVFKDFDSEASDFTIYVGGLSGEMTRVANPSFDASKPESETNPRSFSLRRTLAITYDFPSDTISRHAAQPVRRSREWVMR